MEENEKTSFGKVLRKFVISEDFLIMLFTGGGIGWLVADESLRGLVTGLIMVALITILRTTIEWFGIWLDNN